MLSNSFTRKVNTQAKWMFLLVILPLYMYCGSIIISAFLKFIIITFSLTLSESTINCYVNLLFDLGMLIIVWLTFKDSMIEQWHDFKQDIKGHLLYGLLIGTALVYGVGIVGGFITLLLGGASTSENQNLIQTIVAAHPFLMSLTTVVFAPLLEEMIFRGIVFGWVYEINPKLAHLVSAFVFGFFTSLSLTTTAGLAFFKSTDSLSPPNIFLKLSFSKKLWVLRKNGYTVSNFTNILGL